MVVTFIVILVKSMKRMLWEKVWRERILWEKIWRECYGREFYGRRYGEKSMGEVIERMLCKRV